MVAIRLALPSSNRSRVPTLYNTLLMDPSMGFLDPSLPSRSLLRLHFAKHPRPLVRDKYI